MDFVQLQFLQLYFSTSSHNGYLVDLLELMFFFVISGFLMTSIIFNGVEKDSFNLFKFYNARANRIIPVLAAVSAVLIIFGWFYLLPTDYSDLGKQIEKSALFISNLLFAEGGGYFDTAEHTKWLLHTWSLSVEWQFYICFPIIIITLKKYLNFTNLKRAVISLFIASFIFSMYATYKDSKTAYFLLTSRAWEMLFGGLAFLYPWSLKNKLQQISTQCFGLILIGTSYFFDFKRYIVARLYGIDSSIGSLSYYCKQLPEQFID